MTNPSRLDELIHRLGLPDREVRRQAILELMKLGDPAAIPALIEVAGSDPDLELRYYARKATHLLRARAGHGEAPTSAATGSDSGSDGNGPHAPAAATTDIGTPAAAELSLLRTLLDDARVRGSPATVDRLRVLITGDHPRELLANAIARLAQLGSPEDLPRLRTWLVHPDPRVRANAVDAVLAVGGTAALSMILPSVQDPDNRVRQNAMAALSRLGTPQMMALLRDLALGPVVAHRDSVIFTLSRCDDRAATDILGEIARHDPVASLRQKARGVLYARSIRGDSAARRVLDDITARLPDALPSASTGSAATATDAPVVLAAADGTPPSADLPGETNSAMLTADRPTADPQDASHAPSPASAICPPSDGFERVAARLRDPVDLVRTEAIDALLLLDATRALPLIEGMLDDPSPRVVARAILAMTRQPGFDPLPGLERTSRSADPEARRSALYVVALLEQPQLIPLIDRMLEDPEPALRQLAGSVLRDYTVAGVEGAEQLASRLRIRHQIARQSASFFENEFDRWFSYLWATLRRPTSSNDQRTGGGAVLPVPTLPAIAPEDALSELGERAVALGMIVTAAARGTIPASLAEELQSLERDLTRLRGQLQPPPPPDPPATPPGAGGPQPLPPPSGAFGDGARPATADEPADRAPDAQEIRRQLDELAGMERQQRRLQLLENQRRLLLREIAKAILRRVSRLDESERQGLGAALDRALAMQFRVVPPRDASLLPEPGAGTVVFFDLGLRIYQKHVLAFSLVMIAAGFAFSALPAGSWALVSRQTASDWPPWLSTVNQLLVAILALGTLAVLTSVVNVVILHLVEAFLAGGQVTWRALLREVRRLLWPAVWLRGRRWVEVALHSLASLVVTLGVTTLALQPGQRQLWLQVLLQALVLSGLALTGFRVWLDGLLAEPLLIYEGLTPTDALATSRALIRPHRRRTFLLITGALLMFEFLTATTGEVIDLLARVAAVPRLSEALLSLSALCLWPIVVIPVGIFALAIRRDQGGQHI